MLISRQDQGCALGSVDPYCSPAPNDTWNNGTFHQFKWNPSFPFYSTSETMDLYLYYKENLQFMPIKNWTSLPSSTGSWSVQVDDTWFPWSLTTQPQKQWTLYGLYLPSNINPTQELSNPDSQYPRPFNFSVMQFSSSQNGNHYNSTSITTITGTQNDNSTSSSSQSNDMVHTFPIWAIIVLAITSATLGLMLLMALLWFLYRRSPSLSSPMMNEQDAATNNKVLDQEMPSSNELKKEEEVEEELSAPSPLMDPRHSDASWQRRSSLLSSSNAAILGETVQRMMDSPDWDDQEERRRQLGDQLLRKELEADQETIIKDTRAAHKYHEPSSSKE